MTAVTLCECFARDGLQHEPQFIPTETKRALVERFAGLGFQRIEATSYSNPKVVPQFADASELLRTLSRRENVFYFTVSRPWFFSSTSLPTTSTLARSCVRLNGP